MSGKDDANDDDDVVGDVNSPNKNKRNKKNKNKTKSHSGGQVGGKCKRQKKWLPIFLRYDFLCFWFEGKKLEHAYVAARP